MKSAYLVYVLDEDSWFREMVEYDIRKELNLSLVGFSSLEPFFRAMEEEKPNCIVMSSSISEISCIQLYERITGASKLTDVIVISTKANMRISLDLLRRGAYSCIPKDEFTVDQLKYELRNILQRETLKSKALESGVIETKNEKSDIEQSFDPNIRRLIQKAALTDLPSIITGETGAGKETVARLIHKKSEFKDQPFIQIDVKNLSAKDQEKVLFGQVKLIDQTIEFSQGGLQKAKDGIAFIHEISSLYPSVQRKLLTALESKAFVPDGSDESVRINCKVVVSTSLPWKELIKEGFDRELYFHLQGVKIELSPLRFKGKDIIVLAKYFIERFRKERELGPIKIHPDTVDKLLNYHFPGNTKELKRMMELACILTDDSEIRPEHLHFQNSQDLHSILKKETTLKGYTRKIVGFYLHKYDHNIKLVSEKLDIGVSSIYKMIKHKEID